MDTIVYATTSVVTGTRSIYVDLVRYGLALANLLGIIGILVGLAVTFFSHQDERRRKGKRLAKWSAIVVLLVMAIFAILTFRICCA